MPAVDHIYAQNLRTALGRTEFTQKVIDRIGMRNAFAKKFGDSIKGQQAGDEQKKLLWRTPEDHARFEKYKLYSDLYSNDQERHLMPEWLPTGKREYKRHNLLRFLTNTYVDLMLGGGALIKTGLSHVDDVLNDDLCVATNFDHWAKMASVKGMIGVQVVDDDRGVSLILVRPEILFVEFDDGSDDEFKYIAKKYTVDPSEVRPFPGVDWEFNKGRSDGKKDDGIVFEERHYKGRIEYYLYTVRGDEITEALHPRWYDYRLPELDNEGVCKVDTEIDEFMLQAVPNVLFDQRFISDYDDVIDHQRDINARATQINRILNMHADPKLMVPESFMAKDPYTGEPIMRGVRDEVLFIANEDQDNRPEYLTWNSQLEQGFAEIEQDINMFCTTTGLSPSLIVRKDGQFPEAASAYRLRLTPTLAKVKTKAEFFKRYLRRALWVLIKKLDKKRAFTLPSPHSVEEQVEDDKEYGPPMSAGLDEPPVVSMDKPLGVMRKPKRTPASVGELRVQDITLRFVPLLPQDERFLVERAQTDPPTASLRRILREVDDMTDEQIEEEIAEIQSMVRQRDEMTAGGLGFGQDIPESLGPTPELRNGGLNASPTGGAVASIGSQTY